MVTTAASVLMLVLTVGMVLALIRLIEGPSLPDRAVALDLMTTIAVSMIAMYAIVTGESVFLDAALILALIAFIGTISFARYIARRGQTGQQDQDAR
jgi:multicomponent Na+:H+ antiporter subunit F